MANGFVFPACQMITDVVNLWGQLNLFRNIHSSQGRFWLATAGAWWSYGIWALVMLSNSSWANRYVVYRADLSFFLLMMINHFTLCWAVILLLSNLVWWLNMCVFVCVWTPLQQLESLVWERSGNLFVSSHNDGGYSVWAVTNGDTYNHQPVSSTIPYGEKCIHHPHVYTHTLLCVPS